MKEFKQFTHKQWGIIICFALGVVILGYCLIQFMVFLVSDETKAEAREPKLYQVLRHDDDGYYVAVEVVQTEDGTHVPLNFYEEEDKIVFYLPEDVEGRLPNVDELIKVRVNAYGENPIISAY